MLSSLPKKCPIFSLSSILFYCVEFVTSYKRILGNVNCGAIPMAIGVHTDMCTPALARFGSDELRRQFLVPSIAGDFVGCLGVSETGSGSDVASIKTTAVKKGGK